VQNPPQDRDGEFVRWMTDRLSDLPLGREGKLRVGIADIDQQIVGRPFSSRAHD
jgi:hypothetical protein